MKDVDVTILMSVYNGEEFLEGAIKSILNQSYKNFVFLILDDGSTDQSWKIIASFSDQRIIAKKYIENIGLTRRLIEGVAMAKTKYLARMDCDEICSVDRLQKQREFMEKNDDYSAVGSNFVRKTANDKEIFRSNFPLDSQSINATIFQKNPFRHASLFFRTKKLIDAGNYDAGFKYAQDYDLMLRMSAKYKTANLPDCLLTDIHTSEAISQKHRFEQSVFALKAQYLALTKYGYSRRNIIYLPRTLGYVIKSLIWQI